MKPWDEVRRLLCIRLDSLGDLLMTTPALQALSESYSSAQLTLLTSSAGSRLSPFLPMIDETIVFDAPWMKATQQPMADATRAMIDQLAQGRFDAAVIFTVFSQNPLPAAMICHLAGIPRCLAYCRENPYQLLSPWIAEPERTESQRHEVQRQLDLVGQIGASTTDIRLRMVVPDSARQGVEEWLREMQMDEREPWIVVHAGATAPSRRYPPEMFAEAIRMLYDQGVRIVLTGSSDERSLVEELQTLIDRPVASLLGRTDLGQLAALVQRSWLLLSNNTGPVHVAAAVGTPVINLYALTNPQHTPWQVPHTLLFEDVPCRNCYKSVCPEGHQNCLRLVRPERVVQASLQGLRQWSPSTRNWPQHFGSPDLHSIMCGKEDHVHVGD